MTLKTAILFFSYSAEKQAEEKQYGLENAAPVFSKALISNCRNQLYQTNLPVYEYNENNQIGNSFGERLANSIAAVFEEGADNVIVVGNDTPELTAIKILEVRDLLHSEPMVVGPTQRGGVYTIGINKLVFDRERFKNIKWNLRTVYKELQAYGQSAQLPVLNEIHHYKDFVATMQHKSNLDQEFLEVLNLILFFFLQSTWSKVVAVLFAPSFREKFVFTRPPPVVL